MEWPAAAPYLGRSTSERGAQPRARDDGSPPGFAKGNRCSSIRRPSWSFHLRRLNSLNALIVQLVADLRDARCRTLALIDDLSDRELGGRAAGAAAEPLWELGHVAWYQERWTLRELQQSTPILRDADLRFDSAIAFRDRRRLALPSREATLRYLGEVLENVVAALWRRGVDERATYLHRLVTAHEDLHAEGLVRARHALELPPPSVAGELVDSLASQDGSCLTNEPVLHMLERAMADRIAPTAADDRPRVRIDVAGGTVRLFQGGAERELTRGESTDLAARALLGDLLAMLAGPDRRAVTEPAGRAGPCRGDVAIPGGRFELGAPRDADFALESERWAHEVDVAPFRIARAPVTQAEFAEFVDAGGYQDARFWSAEGARWLDQALASRPGAWRMGDDGTWYRKDYDRLVPLEPHRPMTGVSWHEAQAYCRWAQRRLPTEAEWEFAASVDPSGLVDGRAHVKRRYPWGDQTPTAKLAHLDLASSGTVDVNAFAEGDSAFGLRQMIGNVWEWTASDFAPYPSSTWNARFSATKALRGGSFATRARLVRNTLRCHYPPERRDVLAGFRTVAL